MGSDLESRIRNLLYPLPMVTPLAFFQKPLKLFRKPIITTYSSCHKKIFYVNIIIGAVPVIYCPCYLVIGLKTPYLRAKVQSFQIVSVARPSPPQSSNSCSCLNIYSNFVVQINFFLMFKCYRNAIILHSCSVTNPLIKIK